MKIAFFVEGYTEQKLIRDLCLYYYGEKNISFALFRIRGGNKVPVTVVLDEQYTASSGNPEYTVNIYDCCGFTTLRSMILHQAQSLYNNGFDKIVGFRDVHPDERKDIPKLRMMMPLRVPQRPIQKHFHLCVMETEAWFIADEKHFLRISTTLTNDFIKDRTGIDIKTVNVEDDIDFPAETLNNIYNLAGESYEKTLVSINRTINSLSMFDFFDELPEKIPSLKLLISYIEGS